MILDTLGLEHCLPIRIGDGPSLSGSRIGGSQPQGIFPTRLSEPDYLLTLVLDGHNSDEVSLFTNHDWWDFFFDQQRVVSSDSEPWIEFVVHGPSIRATDDSRRPLLPPCPFTFGAPMLDRIFYDSENDEVTLFSDHKLGGCPYFIKSTPDLLDAVHEIEQNGYRQLLQLAFPSSQDAKINADWPFAGSLFNLYAKYDNERYSWYLFLAVLTSFHSGRPQNQVNQ